MPESALIQLGGRHGPIAGYAVVDAVDAHLAEGAWYRNASGYVVRDLPRQPGEKRRRNQRLHRVILGLDFGDPREVDHINGDRIDNRRANLRIATRGQNMQNQCAHGGTSPHRGVSWNANTGKWRAQAVLEGRTCHVGLFEDERLAAAAAEAFRLEHMPFAVAGR